MAKLDDFQFELFRMLCGDLPADHKLQIGEIPGEVAHALRWSSRKVFVTTQDAQKIRFHSDHGMTPNEALQIVPTVERGDYYQQSDRGTNRQIVSVLNDLNKPKRCHFAVLCADEPSSGIFLRTFFRSSHMSRNKLRGATVLRKNSGTEYFKDVEGDLRAPQIIQSLRKD